MDQETFSNLFEYYENLITSIGIKFNFENITEIPIEILNRAILKPDLYSLDSNTMVTQIITESILIEKEEAVIYFLSNTQIKTTIDLNSRALAYKRLKIMIFLFNNIQKESIKPKIKELKLTKNTIAHSDVSITLSTTISNSNSDSRVDSNKDLGFFFISKENKSITFQIPLGYLLVYLYHLNRIDDLIYLYDSAPEILFSPHIFSILTNPDRLYILFSSFHLELFINYFIKNVNSGFNTINHLYFCLCTASTKGFTPIFKNIIDSDENSQLLLKIQTKSNPLSFFNLKQLYSIVEKSIDSKQFELSNLLIDSLKKILDH